MNKKFLTALTIVVTTLFTTVSFAQERERREPPKPEEMFKKMDADENGLLTKEEIESDKRGERILEDFNTIDTDKSGNITLEEFTTFFENRKKERSARN